MAELVPALFYEMFGDPRIGLTELPTAPMGRYVSIEAPLVDPRSSEFRALQCFGPDAITSGTGFILESAVGTAEESISVKFHFDERDVLYSKIRPALRKAVLPNGEGLCSADMYPLRPGTGVTREYLWAFLLTDYFTDRAIEMSQRANIPKLNRQQIDSIPMPLPTLASQSRFSSAVAQYFKLRHAHISSERMLDRLLRSLVRSVAG